MRSRRKVEYGKVEELQGPRLRCLLEVGARNTFVHSINSTMLSQCLLSSSPSATSPSSPSPPRHPSLASHLVRCRHRITVFRSSTYYIHILGHHSVWHRSRLMQCSMASIAAPALMSSPLAPSFPATEGGWQGFWCKHPTSSSRPRAASA